MARFSALALFAIAALVAADEGSVRALKGGKKDSKGKKGKGKKGGKPLYKGTKSSPVGIQLGPRPYYIVQQMQDSPLKEKLEKCAWEKKTFDKNDWSIGHRGASLMFPEHTIRSYEAAARMGAGVIECDVTFTKDKELVCRHDQCDLHTTTDVLLHPELAAKCTRDWVLGGPSPRCCTSDFTLAEIKTLCAKMDAANGSATTREEYVTGGVPTWRTTTYAYECPEVPTHKESIELIMKYGAKFTPELKTPSGVTMPYEGFSQEDYAQKMIDEYIEMGVDPSAVYPQSFLWSDTIYWVQNTDFKNAVALEGNYDSYAYDEPTFAAYIEDIVQAGVPIIAPPMWMLSELDGSNNLSLSNYANWSKEAGLDIITWSMERDGPLYNGGGWYWSNNNAAVYGDGAKYEYLEFLRTEVEAIGIFADWPATVTFFAECMGI